jgi:hypothetical protein
MAPHLKETPKDDKMLRDLHVAIESIRNSYDELMLRMDPWLAQVVVFDVDCATGAEEAREVYSTLGFHGDLLDTLLEVRPRFGAGRLHVAVAIAGEPDCFSLINGCLLAVFKFSQFADSRWGAIGLSTLAITGARILGLDSLFVYCLDDGVDTTWIHGFDRLRLKPHRKKFAAIAALGAAPSIRVIRALEQDDRVPMRVPELRQLMILEIERIASLRMSTWEMFAKVSEMEAWALRNDVMKSMCTSCAYMETNLFREASSSPWDLCQGDVDSNLRNLKANDDPPTERTKYKVWRMLRRGDNFYMVREGVLLLRNAAWSLKGAEEAHASATLMKKFHKQYSQFMLISRALLHHGRPLVRGERNNLALARIDRKLDALEKRQPEHLAGRQLFFHELARAAKERAALVSQELPKGQTGRILARRGILWRMLDEEEQAAYTRRAKVVASSIRAIQAEDRRLLMEDRKKVSAAAAAQQSRQQGLMRLSHCRFLPEWLRELAWEFTKTGLTVKTITHRRKALAKGPAAPEPELMNRIKEHQWVVEKGKVAEPDWVRRVAWNRGLMRLAVLVVGRRYFLFEYAFQSPIYAIWAPLTPVPRSELPSTASLFRKSSPKA